MNHHDSRTGCFTFYQGRGHRGHAALWIASLIALALGKTRLHGRINYVFFGLTLTALLGPRKLAHADRQPWSL